MTTQLDLIPGFGERDRILAYFAANHDAYLSKVREFAKDYARLYGSVAIDNVRVELERHGYPLPNEIGIDNRVFGALFLNRSFVKVGMRLSTWAARVARAGEGASFICIYRLRESEAA